MNEYRAIMWTGIGVIVLAAGIVHLLQEANIITINEDVLGSLILIIVGVWMVVAAAIRASRKS
jgi:putative Mn2+ efflux pump MntP